MLRLLVQRTRTRVAPLLALAAALAAPACWSADSKNAAADEAPDIPAFDTVSLLSLPDSAPTSETAPAATRKRLSPLADSIANQVTFLALFQRAFVAAGRDKRLLVDIGRVDTRIATPVRLRAFREAAAMRAPLAVGERLRLRGPWGMSDAVVSGYREWNGRAVATLDVPALVDSLSRHVKPMVALAVRSDSAQPTVLDSCDQREEPSGRLAERAKVVGDSLVAAMRADTAGKGVGNGKPPSSKVTRLAGCFGRGRLIIFADLASTVREPAREPARELAVLLDSLGNVSPLAVDDLRFKTHEALRAFDADGDGVDDVATLGRTERAGGTVVLRLDPDRQRLSYIMSGFAWETF